MSDPLSWALGYTGKKLLDWLLLRGFKEDLPKRLRQVIREWASTLPPELSVHPDALFPDVVHQSKGDATAVQAVRARLLQDQLPAVSEWAAVITARRDSIGLALQPHECQPFFSSSHEQARLVIVDLAQRIHRECRQDERLFKGEMVARVHEIVELLKQGDGARGQLKWAEEHVVMTLGVRAESSAEEREEAKRVRLHAFSEALLGVVSERRSLVQLLVHYAQALGVPMEVALELWMREALRLPTDRIDMRRPVGMLGWRFDSDDQNVSFLGSRCLSAQLEAQQYTAGLVASFRRTFPGASVLVVCIGASGPDTTATEIYIGLDRLLEHGGTDVVVVPFFGPSMEREYPLEQLYRVVINAGVIPVLPVSSQVGKTSTANQDRLAVTSSPMCALQLATAGQDVLCLPVAELSTSSEGEVKVIASDGLACLVAAGMASQLVADFPGVSARDAITTIYAARIPGTPSIPSYERAVQLLQSA